MRAPDLTLPPPTYLILLTSLHLLSLSSPSLTLINSPDTLAFTYLGYSHRLPSYPPRCIHTHTHTLHTWHTLEQPTVAGTKTRFIQEEMPSESPAIASIDLLDFAFRAGMQALFLLSPSSSSVRTISYIFPSPTHFLVLRPWLTTQPYNFHPLSANWGQTKPIVHVAGAVEQISLGRPPYKGR
ncbi:hypothetical protein V8C42DRAFT_83086 [Trichoderma barbatum]